MTYIMSSTTEDSDPPGPIIPILGGFPLIRVLNLFFLILTFIINGLSSSAIINQVSIGQISNESPNYLVPANYAFVIWSLIYLFLAVWGVYQILPRSYKSAAINQGIGYWFIVNAIANCTWIFLFVYRLTALPVVFISIVAITNFIIYLRLKWKYPAKTWIDTLCIHTAWSLYTAWILGAVCVNLWSSSTEIDPIYIDETIAMLVILGIVEIGLSVLFKDPIIVFVGAWTVLANYLVNIRVDRLGPSALTLTIILLLVGVIISGLNIFKIVKVFRNGTTQTANSN